MSTKIFTLLIKNLYYLSAIKSTDLKLKQSHTLKRRQLSNTYENEFLSYHVIKRYSGSWEIWYDSIWFYIIIINVTYFHFTIYVVIILKHQTKVDTFFMCQFWYPFSYTLSIILWKLFLSYVLFIKIFSFFAFYK